MDYADPNKDDRFKRFAAATSAQVLLRFLQAASLPNSTVVTYAGKPTALPANNTTNVVGDVTGSNISINQTMAPRSR